MNLTELYQLYRTTPSDIHEHLETLRVLAKASREFGQGRVVEFGTRGGRSTTALLRGLAQAPGITRLSTCDVDPVALHVVQNDLGPFAVELGVDFEAYLGNTVTMPVIAECDLLFVDTYHTYSQLKRELERHAHRAQLWIALHDTNTFGWEGEDGCRPGLRKAVGEWLQTEAGSSWRVIRDYENNNGLIVLASRQAHEQADLPLHSHPVGLPLAC